MSKPKRGSRTRNPRRRWRQLPAWARLLSRALPTARYLDRRGKLINFGTWAYLQSQWRYRQIGLTEVDGLMVSTIWLGLACDGALFETMVFTDRGIIQGQDRYYTIEEARAGHARIVEELESDGAV